jgi:hypothetical protein
VLCFTAACTKTVRVPEPDYGQLTPEKNRHLIVRTADARYQVERFTMTDSTLVIESIRPAPNTYPARDEGFDQPSYIPYAVPLDSIESISQVRRPSGATGPLLFVGCVVAFYGFLAWLFAEGLSGLEGT